MKKLMYVIIPVLFFALVAFSSTPGKLISKNVHVSFFSHTAVEDITANNYKVLSTIDPTTGAAVFSVPMQSFEFEKALMQEHFNGKDFLNTKTFPKAKFTGKIVNLADVDFDKDGSYEAIVKGELTIKETAKPVEAKGTITVKGRAVIVRTKFNIVLADYGITFKKGKPSTNVAKEVEATVDAEYQPE
jgi:polyisoprenoid-binding protein YceI